LSQLRIGVGRLVVSGSVIWLSAGRVHRELVRAAKAGGLPAPSLSTLQRAVARDVLAGDRAGLAGGERARPGSRPVAALSGWPCLAWPAYPSRSPPTI